MGFFFFFNIDIDIENLTSTTSRKQDNVVKNKLLNKF